MLAVRPLARLALRPRRGRGLSQGPAVLPEHFLLLCPRPWLCLRCDSHVNAASWAEGPASPLLRGDVHSCGRPCSPHPVARAPPRPHVPFPGRARPAASSPSARARGGPPAWPAPCPLPGPEAHQGPGPPRPLPPGCASLRRPAKLVRASVPRPGRERERVTGQGPGEPGGGSGGHLSAARLCPSTAAFFLSGAVSLGRAGGPLAARAVGRQLELCPLNGPARLLRPPLPRLGPGGRACA